jgi:hypothetical protein
MFILPTNHPVANLSEDGLCVDLVAGSFQLHKSGLEFTSKVPLPCFSVLKLDVKACGCKNQAACSGVVVASEPMNEGLFRITLLFLDLPEPGSSR